MKWIKIRRNRKINQYGSSRKIFSQLLLPYNPTPEDLIRTVLHELTVKKGQVLYDLGCGDGRVLRIAAEEFGLHAVGYEIDTTRIQVCRETLRSLPLKIQKKIRIFEQDLFTADLNKADLVYIYGLPDVFPYLVHVIQTCQPDTILILVLYEPGETVKREMGIVIERKISIRNASWFAYIAKKMEKENSGAATGI